MSLTVDKLASLQTAPKTVQQWFERHDPEVQQAILRSLQSPYATKAQVARVLREDPDNPLPFGNSAFNAWAEEVTR